MTRGRPIGKNIREVCAIVEQLTAGHKSSDATRLSFIYRIACGAQKCAAHSLHRLTHERPACERPTRGRRSVGVATAARYRANVTGNSARTDGLHPSWALGLHSTEAASGWSGQTFTGHPAVAMGKA